MNASRREAGGHHRGPAGRGGFNIEAPRNPRGAIVRLFRYFSAEWRSLLVVAAAIVAGSVCKAVGPAWLGTAISDHIEREPDATRFAASMLAVTAIFAGAWIADAINGGFMNRAANRLVYRLRRHTFEHLQRLSMPFFDRIGVGDVISRVTNDIEMLYNALANGFAGMLGGLVSIVGILIAMLILDLRLSLVVLFYLPLLIGVTALIGRLVRKSYRENQRLVGRLSRKINESVTAAKLIKSFHAEDKTMREFERISESARVVGTRAEVIGFAMHPLMRLVNGLALASVVGAGSYLAIRQGEPYTVGLITAFVIYSRRFFEPLRHLSEFYNLIQRALAGAERIFEILDADPEIANAADPVFGLPEAGRVEFKQVSFGYAPGQNVVEDIDLQVQAGQVVALVGPTGAGKTTLVNLLSRFYETGSGRILIDGVDIRRLDIDSLRTRMGVVLQEPYFFADTIMANIKYGRPEASEAAAVEAAQAARADHFIRRLPDGYQTVLAERGRNLSEGERQLLAIARALLADPRILVLDEATSSVDSLTEAMIRDSVATVMRGRTSFIIAHRLSTIRHADLVAVMHNRRIVERGTHRELIAKDGFYARLYKMQFEQPQIYERNSV